MKKIFKIPYDLWMRFAHALGWVNSKIILTVVYFVILGLYAIPYRLRALRTHSKKSPAWVPKEPIADPEKSIRRQF